MTLLATYLATYDGRTRKVQVEEPLPGTFKVTLEDREYLVDFLEPQPNLLSLIIAGRSFEVDVDAAAGGDLYRVEVKGDGYEVEVVEERRKKLAMKRAKGASGRQDLRSPMAGNVRRVLAAPGDRVEAGQVLLILEAMKMQNQITSPIAGLVASMSAREGVPVAMGDPLCVVEPLPLSKEQP